MPSFFSTHQPLWGGLAARAVYAGESLQWESCSLPVLCVVRRGIKGLSLLCVLPVLPCKSRKNRGSTRSMDGLHGRCICSQLGNHPTVVHYLPCSCPQQLAHSAKRKQSLLAVLLVQALEYLLVRGSQAAVELGSSRELHTLLQQLTTFEAIGSGGTDCGVNVRVRSAAVLELLQDPQLLQQRRAAAAERLRAIAPAWQQQYGQYTIGGGGNSSSSSSFAGYSRDQLLPPHAAAAADLFAAPGVGRDSYNNGYDSYNGISGGYTLPGSSSSNSVHQQQQQPAFGGSTPAARDSAAAAAAGGVRSGNFGEAKGVSFEENKLRIAELRQLLARPENRWAGQGLVQVG